MLVLAFPAMVSVFAPRLRVVPVKERLPEFAFQACAPPKEIVPTLNVSAVLLSFWIPTAEIPLTVKVLVPLTLKPAAPEPKRTSPMDVAVVRILGDEELPTTEPKLATS